MVIGFPRHLFLFQHRVVVVPHGDTDVFGVPHDVDVLGGSCVGKAAGNQVVREMALEGARTENVARHVRSGAETNLVLCPAPDNMRTHTRSRMHLRALIYYCTPIGAKKTKKRRAELWPSGLYPVTNHGLKGSWTDQQNTLIV